MVSGWRERINPRNAAFSAILFALPLVIVLLWGTYLKDNAYTYLGQVRDLADDPQMDATLQAMRDRLDRWMAETDDPLLKLKDATVPAPPGAVVNDPKGLSPQESTYVAI